MKISIEDLLISNRNRSDFGDVFKLAEGIKTYGLLHPIVVTETTTEEREQTGKLWKLVAGERRVRASLLNQCIEIEATLKDSLNPVQHKEIELEENINRKDISWHEKIEGLRQLDEIKRALYGDSSRSDDKTDYGDGWNLEKTAEAVGKSLGSVSEDISLAKDLKQHPDIAAKVQKLPKHAAKRLIATMKKEKRLKKQVEANKLKIDSSLMLGDCVDLIDNVLDNSVDLWLTDPPFGTDRIMNVVESIARDGTPTHNVCSEETMFKVYEALLPKVWKKLKPGAHFYMFFGHHWYNYLTTKLRSIGFVVDDSPLIWDKCKASFLVKDFHYKPSYEAILYGHKPPVTRPLRKPIGNVLRFPTLHHTHKVHPLQRPEELIELLIDNSSGVGDCILDTFAGSGVTLVVALKMQRSAIGFELDEGNFLRAQEYLQKSREKEQSCK